MKIGVITWFKYINYGTILQAVALQDYLKKQNVEPSLIEVPYIDIEKKKDTRKYIQKIIDFIFNRYVEIKYKRQNKIKASKFFDEIYKKYSVKSIKTSYTDLCNSFDMLICGSDQIWNPNWFNDYYFANYNSITVPKISYAASIGVDSIPEYLCGSYYNALKSFKALSVRENVACDFLKNNLGIECKTVIDPVFLLSKEEWENKLNDCSYEDYVFCYMLDDNKVHWREVRRFARRHGLRIVVIPMKSRSYFISKNIIADAGPIDFITYINKAKYIITDSFHATAFSIIFEKDFYIFERTSPNDCKSQNSRIYNLLNECGLEDRLVKYQGRIDEKNSIEYDVVNKKVKRQIDFSKKFVDKEINGNMR